MSVRPGHDELSAPSLSAFVIDFGADIDRVAVELEALGSFDVRHAPAVRAESDRRWTERTPAVPSKEIGVGAAGCLLAHVDVWRTWGGEPGLGSDVALVLEADAALTDYGRLWFREVLGIMRKEGIQILQVGANRDGSWMSVTKGGTSLANRLSQVQDVVETQVLRSMRPMFSPSFGWGTHAYLVTRDTASWLSKHDLGFLLPIDLWLRSLALDSRYAVFRVRQQLWTTTLAESHIDSIGR